MTRKELWRSLRLLFRRGEAEAEFADELAYHAEMRARELVAAGIPPAEARRRAESEMGGTARLKDDLREVHGAAFAATLDALRADIRVALRRIRRAPAFSTAIIASAAIAIGANAAVYTAVRSLLIAPLPIADVDRVVWVTSSTPNEPSGAGLLDWEAQSLAVRRDAFATFAVIGDRSLVRQMGQERSRWYGLWVTTELDDLLEMRPAVGRAFNKGDVAAGTRPMMMISHERWVRDFGADTAVVGRILHFIDNKSFVVVGVLPRGLEFPFGRSPQAGNGAGYRTGVQDFWMLGQSEAQLPGGTAIARLATGASHERAQAVARTAAERRATGADTARTIALTPVREQALGIAGPGLELAQGFAILMLVLASANLANLMLLRLRGRSTELAVIAALGGSRRSVVRMIAVEAAVLVGAGASVGCLAAAFAPQLFGVLSGGTMPLLQQIRVDWSVAAYMLIATLGVVGAVAVMPAMLTARQPLASTITIGGRSQTADRRMQRFRAGLVVFQVALAFVLSVGAGLITTSFGRLTAVDTGYDPSGVIAAEIEVFDHRNVVEYYRALDRRLRAIPGVEAVGLIHSTPLTGKWSFSSPLGRMGHTYPTEGPPRVAGSFVAFDYFGAMRIPVVRGRSFTDAEFTLPSSRAVMINESAARRFFPGENPVDQLVVLNDVSRRIVGVVRDTRDVRLDAPAEPMWYEPGFGAGNQLIVRSSRPLTEVLPIVRRELLASDPGLVIERIGPFDEIVAGTLSERRLAMRLVTILASLATALCIVGLYGVLGFVVRQRRRELGVRSALGAPRRVLLVGVVRNGLTMAMAGIVIGVVVAIGGTSLMAGLLYEVDPLDPGTFVRIVLLFLVTAGAATLVPGISAMRTDPAIALRDD